MTGRQAFVVLAAVLVVGWLAGGWLGLLAAIIASLVVRTD